MTSEEALAIVKEYMSFRDSKDFHRWIAPPVGIQTVWDAIAIVWHMAKEGAPPGYHIVPDEDAAPVVRKSRTTRRKSRTVEDFNVEEWKRKSL